MSKAFGVLTYRCDHSPHPPLTHHDHTQSLTDCRCVM
jgi:hypothetical protein